MWSVSGFSDCSVLQVISNSVASCERLSVELQCIATTSDEHVTVQPMIEENIDDSEQTIVCVECTMSTGALYWLRAVVQPHNYPKFETDYGRCSIDH